MSGGDDVYSRDKRKKKIVDNPWYGRCHTDVTELYYRPIPQHASQDANEPVPNFDRCATDVTEGLHSRHNSPSRADQDCYYGKVSTDITEHLATKSPRFVNPQCGEEWGQQGEPYFGVRSTDVTNYKISPPESPPSRNLTEFMHPLGRSCPFPFTQMFYHDGRRSKSRNASPPSRGPRSKSRSASPPSRGPSDSRPHRPRPPRHQGSPGGGYRSPPRSSSPRSRSVPRHISPSRSRRRSRSRSPPRSQEDSFQATCGGYKSPPRRQGQPSNPCSGGYGNPPRCPSPSSLQKCIPSPFLNCGRRCQLNPPCKACQELLDSKYWHKENSNDNGQQHQSAEHCTGITMGGGSTDGQSHCQFHGTTPCPAQAGLPCYGMRPWGSN